MINTSDTLNTLIDRALAAQYVALDTEFVWEQTYYPKLGIVQLAFSEQDCVLIDALAIQNLAPLGRLLASPQTVKILHDAQQDLWILKRATGALPQNIFDTRCAAGFAGMSSTISLSNLLRESLGVQLPKTETRTDWLRRPLSEEQLAYALDDVRYLPAARKHLLKDIRKQNREAWLQEELSEYDTPELYDEKRPREQFLRVKGTSRITSRELAVIRELAAWREEEARDRDRPKNRIFPDSVLVDLARRKPRTLSALKRFNGPNAHEIRACGPHILEAVKKGLSVKQADRPQLPKPTNGTPCHNAQLDLAMAYMKGKSLASGIDIPLVASRSEIKDLIADGQNAHPENHRLLRGWRHEFLGEELQRLLTGQGTIQINAETGLPQLKK